MQNSGKKDKFVVNTFEGLQFIFYKDEFKIWRKLFSPLRTWSSAVLVTPKFKQKYGANSGPQKYPVDSNLAQRWSKIGWNQNCVWYLRNRAGGSWGELFCRVSSYDNRLMSFSNFSSTCSLFLPNLYKPDLFSRVFLELVAAASPDTFTVYTFNYILKKKCAYHWWLGL